MSTKHTVKSISQYLESKIHLLKTEINTNGVGGRDLSDTIKKREIAKALLHTLKEDNTKLDEISEKVSELFPSRYRKISPFLEQAHIRRRENKELIKTILSGAVNPDLDMLMVLQKTIILESELSEDDITRINNAIMREPANIFKTKEIVPHIEIPDVFMLSRRMADLPGVVMCMTIPMRFYDEINCAVEHCTVMSDTNPHTLWLCVSNIKINRDIMFDYHVDAYKNLMRCFIDQHHFLRT